MDFAETHSQCPAHEGMVRRNVEEKRDESSNRRVELSAEATTSRHKVSLRFCCRVCRDCGLCRAHRLIDSECEDDGLCLCAVCTTVEDIQRGNDKGTAAAQMPNTKHKARAPVVRRQLSNGSEAAAAAAAALRDQCSLPLLTVRGAVSLANLDPRETSTPQAANPHHTNIYKQEEVKAETKEDKSKNTTDVHKHMETMQSYMWGQSRINAPDSGPVGRTRCLHTAGIFPQEQITRERFCGTPFRLQ